MLSKSVSLVQRLPLASRGFATKGSGNANRGGGYEDISTNHNTSNSPNYGTSNHSGGGFSGSTNKNVNGASNTTSPGSASKATSTSGTSQAPGSGTSATSNNSTPKTVNDSSKSNATGGGTISDFFKSAFGSNKNSTQPTNSTSTESSNLNRPSIPRNEGSPNARTPINDNVNASPKDREPTGSVGPSVASSSSSHSQSSSAASSSRAPPSSGSASGSSSSGGSFVNRSTIGDNYSTSPGPSGSSSADGVSDYERARAELPFNDVGTRYAYLLWSMYKDEKALNSLDSDLEDLINKIDGSPALLKVFEENELATESNREEQLNIFLKDSPVNIRIESFLRTVGEMRRLSDLPVILNAVQDVREIIERKKKTAIVASARELSEEELNSIKKTIQDTFQPDGTIEIIEEIKPELEGGFEIFYDGKYHLDNSQRSLIADLEDEVDTAIDAFISKRTSEPNA